MSSQFGLSVFYCWITTTAGGSERGKSRGPFFMSKELKRLSPSGGGPPFNSDVILAVGMTPLIDHDRYFKAWEEEETPSRHD